ncbi:6-bladed beta-propeller [Cyclobacterium plantarum]|uniref:6-bladed beta-propeller n=1 Tax=Cyclobacterium plantarum TaxID=2716263 RepID=UPI003F723888
MSDSSSVTINPKNAFKSIKLSEIVDSVSYIRLENTKESLIGKAHEIVVKNKFIYVRDAINQAVLIFDLDGKFVSKLHKKGEGPDEYIRMEGFLVNEEEGYIDILDFRAVNSRIIRYSLDTFEPLNEVPTFLPSSNSVRKEKTKNIYYFSTQQNENEIGNELVNAALIAVKENSPPVALFNKKIVNDGSFFSPNTESLTRNKKGEIFASLMYNNTFFRLSDMKAEPVLTVDFDGYGIDNAIGLKSVNEQKKYLKNETDGLASFPVLNIYDSNITAFTYYFKTAGRNQLHHYIHFKNTNQTFHTRDIINDLTNYPEKVYLSSYYYAVNHEVLHENYLVDVVLPWHSNEGKTIEIPGVGKIEPEDNPVIVMMKLKDKYIQ